MDGRQFVGGDLRLGANPPLLQHFAWPLDPEIRPTTVMGVADIEGRRHQFLQDLARLVTPTVWTGHPVRKIDADVVQQAGAAQPGGDQKPGRPAAGAGSSPRPRNSR